MEQEISFSISNVFGSSTGEIVSLSAVSDLNFLLGRRLGWPHPEM
jgi:hypothetical protein